MKLQDLGISHRKRGKRENPVNSRGMDCSPLPLPGCLSVEGLYQAHVQWQSFCYPVFLVHRWNLRALQLRKEGNPSPRGEQAPHPCVPAAYRAAGQGQSPALWTGGCISLQFHVGWTLMKIQPGRLLRKKKIKETCKRKRLTIMANFSIIP